MINFESFCEKYEALINGLCGRFRNTSLTDSLDYRQVALIKLWHVYKTKPESSDAYVAACLYRAIAKFYRQTNRTTKPIIRSEAYWQEIPLSFYLPDGLTDDEHSLLSSLLEGDTVKLQRSRLKMQYRDLKNLKESLREKMNYA